MPTPPTKPRDVVTEASMDSFPASDPPGWIRSSASTCDDPSAPSLVEPIGMDELPSAESGPHLRRTKRILLAAGVLVAAGAVVGTVMYPRRR